MELFFWQVTLKIYEIWGLHRRIDANSVALYCTYTSNIHGSSVAESIFTI